MYRVTPQLLLASSRVPPILRLEPSSSLSTSSAVMSEETSKPFYKRWFGGKKKAVAEESEPDEFEQLEELEKEYQEEMRRKELRRKRNKSGLSASDRRMLNGEPPLMGLQYPMYKYHFTQAFRKKMFGLYGQASGVRPEECWPDSETIRQYREYEKVFYDGKTFEEIVAEERQKNDDARKYRVDREARVTANLERMERQMKQMEDKNKAKLERIAKEQEKRTKILQDLRQEYGYDIDPLLPQFAERLAEKEKEYTLIQRQERKAMKAEQRVKFSEENAEAASKKAEGAGKDDKKVGK